VKETHSDCFGSVNVVIEANRRLGGICVTNPLSRWIKNTVTTYKEEYIHFDASTLHVRALMNSRQRVHWVQPVARGRKLIEILDDTLYLWHAETRASQKAVLREFIIQYTMRMMYMVLYVSPLSADHMFVSRRRLPRTLQT
jgi:hypothetical protein